VVNGRGYKGVALQNSKKGAQVKRPSDKELIKFKDSKNIKLVRKKVFDKIPPLYVYTGDDINYNDPYEAYMITELQLWANGE